MFAAKGFFGRLNVDARLMDAQGFMGLLQGNGAGAPAITADSTVITADSTTVTADNS